MKEKSPYRNDFFEALISLRLAVAKVQSCGDLSLDEIVALAEVLHPLDEILGDSNG